MNTQQVDIELLKLLDRKIIDVYVEHLQLKQKQEKPANTGIKIETARINTRPVDTKFMNILNNRLSFIIQEYAQIPDLIQTYDSLIETCKGSLDDKDQLINLLKHGTIRPPHLRVIHNTLKQTSKP